jgi:hypothetical protein
MKTLHYLGRGINRKGMGGKIPGSIPLPFIPLPLSL